MPTTQPNPLGLDGFEFIEFAAPQREEFAAPQREEFAAPPRDGFAAPQRGPLEAVLAQLGFTAVARHRSKDVTLFRQGDINFVVNHEPRSPAAWFAAEHGAGACAMAFRVQDAHVAYDEALRRGAQPVEIPTGPMELRLPAIRGLGGAPIYLVDRYHDVGGTLYDIDFRWLPGVERRPRGVGLQRIDHLTHNVYRGRMAYWASFYESIFGFREIRHFDIQGERTGLVSRAMTAPDGLIRIPLNEEARQGGGQIEEFLMRFNGEGIQHIALATDDLPATIDALRARGVPLMSAPPDTYYEMLESRLPGHGLPLDELRTRGILLDGRTSPDRRLLLQIFSECLLGPVFFEFIQRERDEGFGEGNFKALFEAMERDQLRRGALA